MQIKLIGIQKDYLGVQVLNDINFDINPGSFIALTGETGAGKTTLLNVAAGLLVPGQGRVYYDGKTMPQWHASFRIAALRRKICHVAQHPILFSQLSVRENVFLPVVLQRKITKEARKACDRLLEMFGLMRKQHFKPGRLSGGEIQKTALIRSFLSPGDVMFLDEPATNLDRGSVESVRTVLREMHKAGCTVVMATHSERLAGDAQDVFVLKDGRLVEK
jgi:putative ABC transport system ATP-binding protein